jgi:hypothetical protein
VHRFNRLDRQDRRHGNAATTDSLQTGAVSGKIDKFRHS